MRRFPAKSASEFQKVKNEKGPRDKRILSSAVRCLQVVHLLSTADDDLAFNEIAQKIGLPPSTTHRILKTLVDQGFLHQRRDRRYGLGIEAFAVGASFLRKSPVRRAAVRPLLRLAEETRANVNLAFWHRGTVVFVECLPTPDLYQFYAEPGDIAPAHATALGKCLLAFRGKEALSEVGPPNRYTKNTICTMNELNKELAQIRVNGYAVDHEEYLVGCLCIAAPILQNHEGPSAAVSMTIPATTLERKKIPEFAALVKETCLKISIQLGYRPRAIKAVQGGWFKQLGGGRT